MKRILAVLLAALLLPVYALADSENTVVRVGVTGAFYDDLWQPAIEELAKEGITVETVQFSDFSLPNNALNSGDIELNAFQHHAYFNNDTTTNGYDLSVLADTFVITMNLYSEKYDTIEDLVAATESGKPTVAVPNDATNYGRALLVLRDAGLLELGEYEGTPLEENITSSKVELYPVNASMTYQYLSDVDAAVINGNYAASYGVDPDSGIFDESIDLSDDKFTCLIACRTADLDNETYKRVAEVFCSEVTSKVVEEKFNGFFKLVWEEDAAEAAADTETEVTSETTEG